MKQQQKGLRDAAGLKQGLRAGHHRLHFVNSTIFVVPNGVSAMQIFAVGACGGSGNGFGVLLNNGGEGGTAVSSVKVVPGESLDIFVGVRGQDGGLPDGGLGGCSAFGYAGGAAAPGNAGGGGGGGGASGVTRIRGEEILVIAGGGGGGSGAGAGGIIGRGGAGGSFATNGRGLSPGQALGGEGSRGGDSPLSSQLGSGGGGGGVFGGGAGSSTEFASGGGAGGSGTIDTGLSLSGGGTADGSIVLKFDID